jgi:hypothetical protein
MSTVTVTTSGSSVGVDVSGSTNASEIASGILGASYGGTGVSNAGTLTNASNTTITGGGTIALGGFTLTVPATGSAALLGTANTLTAANTFSNATASTSTTTGAVIVTGGVGIGGAIFVGAASRIGSSGNTAILDLSTSSNVVGALRFTTSSTLRSELQADNSATRLVVNAVTAWDVSAAGTLMTVNLNTTWADAVNLAFGSTTGTKIGTATSQKIGFYNATPVVQGASVADATGGATVDAEARTAINALISRIEALGLIATV